MMHQKPGPFVKFQVQPFLATSGCPLHTISHSYEIVGTGEYVEHIRVIHCRMI